MDNAQNVVGWYGQNNNIPSQRVDEYAQKAYLDVVKDAQKKANRDAISLQTFVTKLGIKEEERERKKSQYDQLDLVNGLVQVITCNLRNASMPIVVANFQQPVLFILKRLADDLDMAYCIQFVIGRCPKSIYFNKNKAGKGGYLLQKFASEGALFKADSVARQKNYAHQLLAYLLNQNPDIIWIAEDEGWAEFPDTGWRYVEGGELTWKKVSKLVR